MKKLLVVLSAIIIGSCSVSEQLNAQTTYTVTVGMSSFSPAVVNAQCGDIIHWEYGSGTSHTTTSTSIPGGAVSWNAPINSGPNPTYTYQVTFPGTYNYECTPHGFTGVINVNCPGCGSLATSLAVTNVTCNGLNNGLIDLSFTVGGGGSYLYSWSNGATTQDVSSLPPTSYTVTVLENISCMLTNTATVTQPAVLTASVSPSDVSCNGSNNGSMNLTVGGGTPVYTYAWSNLATTEDISGLAPNSYSVLVTDSKNCTATAQGGISEPAVLSITLTVTPLTCDGGNNGSIDLAVSGGSSPYDYSWSNSATTQDISGLTANNYTVLVTDDNNCTTTGAKIVSGPPAIVIALDNIVNATTCVSADGAINITASGGTGSLAYQWLPGNSTTDDISLIGAGVYTLTVTDANLCSVVATYTVNSSAPFVVNLGADVTQCGGSVALDAGNPGSVYAWLPSGNTQTISATGTGNYSVSVTNNCGTKTDDINVTIGTSNPVVGLGADVTQCGGSVTLDAGNPGSTYAWSPSGTTQTITALSSGTYSVVVTNAGGCTGSDAIDVTINPNPVVNLGPDVTQCGGNVTLNAGTGTSYMWSTGATTQNITAIATGNYSVTVTDGNGCTGTDAAMVTIEAMPSVNLGADVTQCGGNVTLNAGNAGASYLWSDNSTNQTLVVSATGTYSVVVTNTCGSTNDIVSITINPGVVVNLGADVTQCAGNAILDAGNAGASYAWSTGATTQTITALASGNYSVTVTDANSCTGTDAVNVFIQALPVVNIGPDATFCGSGMLNAGAQPASTYLWSTGASTQTITVTSSGTYSVVVTNSCGSNSDTANIVVNTIPTISAGSNVTVCSGSNTTLSASGGNTYAWAPGGQTTSSIVVAPTVATTYTVTGTSAGGCTNTSTVSVAVSGPSVTSSSTPSNCSANDGTATANATGGSAPYTYAWSGGQTTQTATGLAAGSYTVTVTDAGGCTKTAVVSVATSAPNLQTTFAGGNGQNGNIFDITAVTNIQIVSFDGNLDDAAGAGNGGNMEIWYRPGSYVGFENSSVGWTNLGTVFVNPTSIGIPTAIPININLTLSAGQTYAFYVTGNITGCDVDYTNGTAVGNVYAQNANLQIKEGLGKAYPFGASFMPRIWNGRVHYCTGPVGAQQDNVMETVKGVNVYPNPFVSNATVSLTGADLKNGADVIITDVFGREVMTRKVHTAQFEITKDDLPSGVYFYRVTDVNGTVGTGKLVIE